MEESSNFNHIVAAKLKEETKEDWFEWVKTYLISQGLWKVTSRGAKLEGCRGKEYERRKRKDAKALYVIRISCGSDNLPIIRRASEAKEAWDILYGTYHSPPPAPTQPTPTPTPPAPTQCPPTPPAPSRPQDIVSGIEDILAHIVSGNEDREMGTLHMAISDDNDSPAARIFIDRTYHSPPSTPPALSRPQDTVSGMEDIEMGTLYKAISENNWPVASRFIDDHPRVLEVQFGKSRGETPLHVAAKFGHVGIVEELLRKVEPEYLEIRDASGNTPLTLAAGYSGVIPVAQLLIAKNSGALKIPIRGYEWLIPVEVAFHACLKEMGRYLYRVTPPQLFTENRCFGIRFLRTCVVTGELDLVLDLLQRHKELLFAFDRKGRFATIDMIADHLPDPIERSQLPFLKRCAYDYIIKIPTTTTTNVQQDGENNRAHQGLGLLHRLISSINNLSGMKEICKMKQQHGQADKILNLVCENVMSLDKDRKLRTAYALEVAARRGKVDFFLRVTKANPELVSLATKVDPELMSLLLGPFVIAVIRRRAEVFSLLHGFRFKHVVATTMTRYDSDLLRAAAELGPSLYLNQISGAALQMQRELQWFKAVENMVDPAYRNLLIGERMYVHDLFKRNHKELRKEGEEWMKTTASSCSVVGTLIVTIMFAVAFTLPGGNNQDHGFPLFFENKLFKVFLISDALSLFSSTTSVLTFLGILTSRYAEEDFLYSLPIKLIIGLSTLFLSIATMVVAFSVTIVIVLQHDSSVLTAFLPIAMLGAIPITLFVLLQFPLLVEVIYATYGPGIFKKKVKKWP